MRSHYINHQVRQKEIGGFAGAWGVGGFTLVELLIVTAISGFLMAGMVQMFMTNRQAMALVDDIRNMEQNARVGMDFMARDLRRAGQGAQQDVPFLPIDNTDTTGTVTWASANASFTAKGRPVLAGTDIVEMFWGYLPVPVCVTVDTPGALGFNTNNANMKLPAASLMGLPDYTTTMTNQAVNDLLDPYSVLIYDPKCPTVVNCTQNLTGGTFNKVGGLSVQMDYNRGRGNTDDANRPHECVSSPPAIPCGFDKTKGAAGCPADCPSGTACINIGEDIYYFVQKVEAGNPQLVRYKTGRTVTYAYEVMSNYVEDFQVMYGVDDSPVDGMVGETEWKTGAEIESMSLFSKIRMTRIYLLVKSKKVDMRMAGSNKKQLPPKIENSTIVQPAGGGDFYRRRLMSRTVRMRTNI
ncbi:MAG: PilW family protein [Nitrospinota bacterium]|nr:PilW family protein [Nitrospinota bacterium]